MAKLTLSMIVKNEENFLRDCLESVRNVADEIVIVDTGSTDKTLEIAEEFKAKIFHLEWIKDFSAARNFALQNSTGGWILYLDADERLDQHCVSELKQLITNDKKSGCLCTVFNRDSEHGRDNSMRYVRLFRRSDKIKFSGKVHEQILPSLIENKYEIVETGLKIIHIGYDVDIEKKREKAERNLALLLEDYENTKTAYYAFQIAQTYYVLGDNSEAQKYFRIAVNSNNFDSTLRGISFSTLAQILLAEHKLKEAEEYISKAMRISKDDPFTYLLGSKINFRLGNMYRADDFCKKAILFNKKLKTARNHSLLSILVNEEELVYYGVSIGLNSDKKEILKYYLKELSSMYNSSGNSQASEISFLIERILANSTLSEQQMSVILKNLSGNNLHIFTQLLGNYKQTETRLKLLSEMSPSFPESPEVKKALAKTYDEMGRLDDAITSLKNEVEKSDDPSVLLYIISFYVKKGDSSKVLEVIEDAEKRFGNVPELMNKLGSLKARLLSFVKQNA